MAPCRVWRADRPGTGSSSPRHRGAHRKEPSTQRSIRTSTAALAASLVLLAPLAACGDDGDGVDDDVEQDIEDGVDDVQDSVDDAVDDVRDSVDDAVDDVEDELDGEPDDTSGG